MSQELSEADSKRERTKLAVRDHRARKAKEFRELQVNVKSLEKDNTGLIKEVAEDEQFLIQLQAINVKILRNELTPQYCKELLYSSRNQNFVRKLREKNYKVFSMLQRIARVN